MTLLERLCEIGAEGFNPQDVRKAAMQQLEQMRHDFLTQIDDILIVAFGCDAPQFTISDFQKNGSSTTRELSVVFGGAGK